MTKPDHGSGIEAQSNLSRLLRGLEEDARSRGHRITRQIIASEVGVARSAVSGWFGGGDRKPRAKHLEALAELFAFGNEKLRARYRIDLFDAAGVPLDRSAAQDPMARAREETGIITIGVAEYDNAFEEFFETTIRAFADFCAFRYRVNRVPFKNLSADIAKGEIDIGAGFLVTPDRLQTLKFITPHPPILMGLGALVFAEPKRALQVAPDAPLNLNAIQPIMHEGQAGYQYVQHVLGISHLKIVTKQYDEHVFAAELLNRTARWLADRELPIPVLIVDELMLVRVQAELLGRLLGQRSESVSMASAGPPLLLIGDRKPTWTRAGYGRIASHPQYNISLCVRRIPNDEWYQYLEEAWTIFLSGNAGFLKSEYEILCRSLMERLNTFKRSFAGLSTAASAWPGQSHEANTLEESVFGTWDRLLHSWLSNDHPNQTWREITSTVRLTLASAAGN